MENTRPELRRIPSLPDYLMSLDGNVYSLKNRAWLSPQQGGSTEAKMSGRGYYHYKLQTGQRNDLGKFIYRALGVRKLLNMTYGPQIAYRHKQHLPPPLPQFIPSDRDLREILGELE